MGGFFGDIVRGITGSDLNDQQMINVGLSMIPGVGGYLGGREANAANAQQASDQMAFQERMSSTAHQREVEDLKKAGLNPILSANAGASTPAGSMATMENTLKSLGDTGKGIAELMNSKKDLEIKDAQKELIQSQKNNTDMDTTVKSKGVPEADIKNSVYTWFKKKLKDATKSSAKEQPFIIKGYNPKTKKFQFGKPTKPTKIIQFGKP